MATVLVPIFDGFEEIEALAPVDLLRRAGAEVVVAGLASPRAVTGRSGIRVLPDAALADAGDRLFDMLFLPGGPGVKALREDGRAAVLARRHHDGGKWLAAICAAPLVFKDAGLLEGRRHAAHPSTAAELPQAVTGPEPVRDGRLITAAGAGASIAFGLLLVEVLCGREAAIRVGRAVVAPGVPT